MANSGYLGGNVSMAERHGLRDKYLRPIADLAVERGLHNQCRCGGTRYVRWRGRFYCVSCARFVRKLTRYLAAGAITTAKGVGK